MARLFWRQDGGTKAEFPLGEAAALGREKGLECCIDSKSVSRRHARIERRDFDYFLVDLGSMNGTLVNGLRVEGEVALKQGDQIQIGEEVLEFDLECTTGVPTRGSMPTEPLVRPSRDAATSSLPSASSEDALPRRLGKFLLIKKLGQGGMGVVYQALDLDSNREVGVKFIRSRIGRNEAFLDFFHNREAVLAREIQHPNVITVFEHGMAGDRHYISMELVPGENLYQVLKRGRLEPGEVLEILRQVACGLAAAHREGVVHSDIKPANILLVGHAAVPAHDGGGGTGSSPVEPDSCNLLEFQDEGTTDPSGTSPRYDPGLMEEIRRRVGSPSPDVLLAPPYFVRASESGFLAHYFEKLREDRGYLVLVEGERGSGKDRLISEFLAAKKAAPDLTVDGKPMQFLELDCSRIEGLPLLYEQIHGLRPLTSLGARQFVDGLVRSLAEGAARRVIRILNLGSAIPLACDFIAECERLMEQSGLLLIASLDPQEVRKNGSLKSLLERMSLVTKELYLRPLTEYQIQRYLQQLFSDVLSVTELSRDLYRLSRGNFAKLLETLRGFFDRGILSRDQPSGRLTYRPRAQEFQLEEGKDFFEQYKAHGKIEQRILEQAAFIGPRFLFDTILRLNDINETSLFFVVRTLLGQGFFFEARRGWFEFTNLAFQKYLAGRVPPSERQPLHRKISRLLQSAPVANCPELCQLNAQHLVGFREYSRAVEYLLEGAYMARNEYRVEFVRELYQEVLRIYRALARQETIRRQVTGLLRDWFRRDGNWYEILVELSNDVPRPIVKITDFGISFRHRGEEPDYDVEKRPLLGTPRYMAPERSQGEYGGFKSDIFSLGIITYEIAVGAPPFPDLKGNDVIEANRELRISLPHDVLARFPSGMGTLVAGMLEKDPAKRWDAEKVVREITRLQFDARPAVNR